MSDKELLTTNTRPSREDYPLTEAGDLGFSRALIVWQGDAIDRLTAERDRLKAELDNLRATDIHSCHDGCQRPACVMRRERDALKAENERLRASHEPLTDHMAALIDSAYYEGAKLALIKADESIQVAREWLAGGCNGRRQAALAILRHAPPPPDVQRDARDAEAGRKLWAYLVKQGRPWEEDQDEYAAMGLLVPHDMTAEDSGPECLNCMGDCETCYRPSTTLLVESPTPSQTKGAES